MKQKIQVKHKQRNKRENTKDKNLAYKKGSKKS